MKLSKHFFALTLIGGLITNVIYAEHADVSSENKNRVETETASQSSAPDFGGVYRAFFKGSLEGGVGLGKTTRIVFSPNAKDGGMTFKLLSSDGKVLKELAFNKPPKFSTKSTYFFKGSEYNVIVSGEPTGKLTFTVAASNSLIGNSDTFELQRYTR